MHFTLMVNNKSYQGCFAIHFRKVQQVKNKRQRAFKEEKKSTSRYDCLQNPETANAPRKINFNKKPNLNTFISLSQYLFPVHRSFFVAFQRNIFKIQNLEMGEKGEKSVQQKICNCRNSKCMKLYCECFSAGQECNKNCRCMDCRNQKDSQHNRIYRNIVTAQPSKLAKIEGGKEGKGCSCRKSFCVKKYCECFQEGVLCSQNCKCIQCQNNESMTNKSVLNNLKRNNSNTSNKLASLYPIILSQSADHIHHLINEQNSLNFQEKEIEDGISDLFKSVEQSNTQTIFDSFIHILKRIEGKMTKSQPLQMKEEESI